MIQKLKNKKTNEKVAYSIPSDIIDTKELAKRLKVTTKTVRNHKESGTFPFIKFGSSIRYNWEQVYAALSNHQN